jgi:hypothetical protein
MNTLYSLEINGVGKDTIDLLPKDALIKLEEKDKIGFDIGRDWAFYHQPLPDQADAAIFAGYKNNAAHPSGRKEIDRYTKKWLQVRYHAYQRKRPVAADVDVGLIKALDKENCIITGETLTHGTLSPSDWSVERLCNTAGYAWGNLIIESKRANEARGSMNYEEIQLAAKSKKNINGLDSSCWKRYAEIARGPNFWGGHFKGIEPLSIPVTGLVFFVPSHYLMEAVYHSVCHKSERVRVISHRVMKSFSKSEQALLNLHKLRAKIERKFKERFRLTNIFHNLSVFDAFIKWYQSSTITFDIYKEIIYSQRYPNVRIHGSQTNNPLDEWSLATNGHLF